MSYAHIHTCANRRDVSELKTSMSLTNYSVYEALLMVILFALCRKLISFNEFAENSIKKNTVIFCATSFKWIFMVFAFN
jgi:hypothetical protein